MLATAISGELISSEIEIRSGRGDDVQHALKLQREARRRLFALADAHGVGLASTGTHPLQRLPRPAHHRHRALPPRPGRAAVRRASQQHVRAAGARRGPRRRPRDQGLRPPAAGAADPAGDQRRTRRSSTGAIPACTPRARRRSPSRSRAAACRTCSAPGRRGRTTSRCCCGRTRSSSSRSCGGRCARTTRSGRSRCGSATRRPPGPRRTALVELIVACVAQALREVDAGETPPDIPGRLIEENMWRAIRYGQDGKLLDLDAPESRSTRRRRRSTGCKAWTGVDVALPELNGAQRQRRMIDAGAHAVRSLQAVRGRDPRDVPGTGEGPLSEPEREFTEEELRAIEAEMEKLTVDDVLLQTLVTLINLGARKAGLADAARRGGPQARSGADAPGDRRCPRAAAAARGAARRAARARQGRAVAAPDGVRAAFRRHAAARPERSEDRTIRARRRAPDVSGFPGSSRAVDCPALIRRPAPGCRFALSESSEVPLDTFLSDYGVLIAVICCVARRRATAW